MSKYSKLSWLAAAGTLFMGCANDSDATAGGSAQAGPTRVDVATSQAALTALTTSVDTTITDYKPPPSAAAPALGAAGGSAVSADGGMIALQCKAGGSANVGGHVNVALQPLTVDVKVAIAYEGCLTPDGTRVSGDVNFSQSVVAGAETRVQTIYKGDVEFSGKINASCPVDLNVLVDQTGRAVQVMGTFCGNDASELDVQVTPRWQR